MVFLLRAFKKTRKRLMLENLLLLLLRVLAILFIVMAFMRPVVRLAMPGLRALARSDRDLILVVDTSYSMTYREGSKSIFDKAVEEGLEFVASLDGKGSVALLTASDRPEIMLEYTPNHETVVTTLKALKPTGGATDIAASLRRVHELIADPRFKARGRKRLVFLSDLTRNGWVHKGRMVPGVQAALEQPLRFRQVGLLSRLCLGRLMPNRRHRHQDHRDRADHRMWPAASRRHRLPRTGHWAFE